MNITLLNETIIVTANTQGAELKSIRNLENGIEYLWQANKDIWARHAPNLFPIVGKMDGNYSIDGKEYQMNQHGFARDLPFKLLSSSDTEVVFELTHKDETFKVYPYKFSFQVIYKIIENELFVTYKVKNLDSKTIYFSVGAHPAFNVPLVVNEKFEDYYLEFEHYETIGKYPIENGLIASESKPLLIDQKKMILSKDLFIEDALVIKNMKSEQITLRSHKSRYYIKMKYKGFPYFGIWTKPGFDKFLCLEPWKGIADTVGKKVSFEKKEGIISLEIGKTSESTFSMIFG